MWLWLPRRQSEGGASCFKFNSCSLYHVLYHAPFHTGAWCGYGFHEDGLKAGVAAVKAMGGVIPWEKSMRATSPKRSISDMVYVNLFDK